MQGTWKETVSGWRKDSRRKKTSRKHTIKEKFGILSGLYYSAERKQENFDKNIFRIENDDMYIDYKESQTRIEKPKRYWRKVKAKVQIRLELKKSEKTFKINNSINDLDPEEIKDEVTFITEYIDAISPFFIFKNEKPKYSYYRDYDFFVEEKTCKTIIDIFSEKYQSKKHHIRITVTIQNKKEIIEGFEEYYVNKTKKKNKSPSNRWYTGSIYNYNSVRYIYGKPVYRNQRRYRKNSSTRSVFTKKYTNGMVRSSEKIYCQKVRLNRYEYEGNILVRRDYGGWM